MPAAQRRRRRPSVLDQLDRSGRDVSVSWGRSVRGCPSCGSGDQLAGFELKVNGELLERLCADCAGAGTADELLERFNQRQAGR